MSEPAQGAEQTKAERRDEMRRYLFMGIRPTQAFVDHYIETGILDGRLWPLRVPWQMSERSDGP